jgi:hypothetical protein
VQAISVDSYSSAPGVDLNEQALAIGFCVPPCEQKAENDF